MFRSTRRMFSGNAAACAGAAGWGCGWRLSAAAGAAGATAGAGATTAGAPGAVTTALGCVCTAGRVATAIPPATTAPTATPAPAPAMNSRRVTTGRNCSDPSCGVTSGGPGSTFSDILAPFAPFPGERTGHHKPLRPGKSILWTYHWTCQICLWNARKRSASIQPMSPKPPTKRASPTRSTYSWKSPNCRYVGRLRMAVQIAPLR